MIIPALIGCSIDFVLGIWFIIQSFISMFFIVQDFRRKLSANEYQPIVTNTEDDFYLKRIFEFLWRMMNFVFFVWRGFIALEFSYGKTIVSTSDIPAFLFSLIVVMGVFKLIQKCRVDNNYKGSDFVLNMDKAKYVYFFGSIIVGIITVFALLAAIIILNIGFFTQYLKFYYVLFGTQLLALIILTFVVSMMTKIFHLFFVCILLMIRFVIYIIQTFVFGCDVNYICQLVLVNTDPSIGITLDWTSLLYYVLGECLTCCFLHYYSK
jgi:hypothetical protein